MNKAQNGKQTNMNRPDEARLRAGKLELSKIIVVPVNKSEFRLGFYVHKKCLPEVSILQIWLSSGCHILGGTYAQE